MRHSRLKALALAVALWSCGHGHTSFASQATLVAPGSPLPMTGLALFLNAALLSDRTAQFQHAAPAGQ